jgi:hypothetical protein
MAKNLLTGSLKNRSIDNLETQKKSISMKNSQFFDYLLYSLPLEGLRPLSLELFHLLFAYLHLSQFVYVFELSQLYAYLLV